MAGGDRGGRWREAQWKVKPVGSQWQGWRPRRHAHDGKVMRTFCTFQWLRGRDYMAGIESASDFAQRGGWGWSWAPTTSRSKGKPPNAPALAGRGHPDQASMPRTALALVVGIALRECVNGTGPAGEHTPLVQTVVSPSQSKQSPNLDNCKGPLQALMLVDARGRDRHPRKRTHTQRHGAG